MPDEHSNLNLPAARRPGGRRRGRRGGRGRVPRPVTGKAPVGVAEEISQAPEAVEETVVHPTTVEQEVDSSGGFREPHPEEPVEVAPPEEISKSPQFLSEPGVEKPRAPETEREPRHQYRAEPARPRPWVKPADFRPAETSAISQAVAHATEIAESLKHMIDQLDEILELVELAERQKIADEREIDELRRALRRIQPPRFQQQLSRGPRRDEPRHGRHESHENIQRHDEPTRPPEAEEPPAPAE